MKTLPLGSFLVSGRCRWLPRAFIFTTLTFRSRVCSYYMHILEICSSTLPAAAEAADCLPRTLEYCFSSHRYLDIEF